LAAQSQINAGSEFRPADEECRALVSRILASPEFRRASRLRAFLNYVVERKLAGNPEDVTEVLIGHRVFGRAATYNPGEDSIVRTEARTLRQRLDRYFAEEGAGEPVLLEVPRGSYLPVFHPRAEPEPPAASEPQGASPPALSRRHWIAGAGLAAAGILGAGFWVWVRRSSAARVEAGAPAAHSATVDLESSDERLTLAFQRARERALSCVFTGDAVGDWYASNRDNRAFCMRDTAHESDGAALLGLSRQSLNMLRRFAASIARARDWCGYWIITKDGFPAPSDYTSDADFGYALPANFDLVRTCQRQLLWTGNRQYLDPVFTGFYDRTVSQYVALWDPSHDGIMERRQERPRVTPSYHHQTPHFLTGADLIAAQYAGYLAYAAIQEFKGGPGSLSERMVREYRAKAEALRASFNRDWWDPALNRFYSGILPDHSWCAEYVDDCNVYPLRFGIPEDGPKTDAALDAMERSRPPFDATYSYYPEVLYRYGRNDSAYRYLLEISDPGFSGYGMTETAYASLGAVGRGLAGIDPDAPRSAVETMPQLPAHLEWVRLSNVPLGSNRISVEHRGNTESRFTNHAGETLLWNAVFRLPPLATGARILIDGGAAANLSAGRRPNQQAVLSAAVPVHASQTRTAKLAV
jgi:hypothetical protein